MENSLRLRSCYFSFSCRPKFTIIGKPSTEEKKILGRFKYISNLAVLHRRRTYASKKNSSSWNSISQEKQTCVTIG